MDVHARSVPCKALRPETGECWSKTFSGEGHERELLEWPKKLPGPVRCAYESGCTGFWMSRFLEGEGIKCAVKELAKAAATEAEKPRWKLYVDVLIRLKGIDVQTAFLACAEFGDFSRFRSGRRVSHWIGCTASEGSSGERHCCPFCGTLNRILMSYARGIVTRR